MREAEAEVHVDLSRRSERVRVAMMEHVTVTASVGELTGVFEKHLPRAAERAAHLEGRHPGEIVPALLRGPEEAERSSYRPGLRELPRPGELHLRVHGSARQPPGPHGQ